jgi:hypothetical protein
MWCVTPLGVPGQVGATKQTYTHEEFSLLDREPLHEQGAPRALYLVPLLTLMSPVGRCAIRGISLIEALSI